MTPEAEKIPAKSWLILALVFSAGLLNYFDRQVLSILKGTLKVELGLTDTGYSYLIAAFMVPYIVMYLVSGRIVDRFGSRGPMTIFILAWSGASALAGMVQNLWQLAGARMLLGAAEPGVFPANLRAQVRWFPASRRTFLMSLSAPSHTAGAILAAPVVSLLAAQWGWRSAFIVPGILGVGLAIAWWFSDQPSDGPAAGETREPVPLGTILKNPRFRAVLLARLLTDPVWYFFLFWIPGYMQEKVGLSLPQLGAVGWIPSAVAALAAILSARWSDRAAARHADPAWVRVRLLLGVSLAAPASLLIHSAETVPLLLALLCVIYTIAQLWFFYTAVILTDIFPARAVASALGIVGAMGAAMGALANLGIGPLVEQVGYAPLFIGAAVLHPVGGLIQWFRFRPTT